MIFLKYLLKNVVNNSNSLNRLDDPGKKNHVTLMTSSLKLMEEIRRKDLIKMSKLTKNQQHQNSMELINSGKSGSILLNMMSRDEYEKEKQRWLNKLSDTESELKLSEQTNATLIQAKAELLKRLKDLEKVNKILQENYRKLSEKQKVIFREAQKSEEKFKQCHEANLTLKLHAEKFSQEQCKVKLRNDKHEEFEKLKQQNLNYCKLIAGLKRSEHEKDRKIDILYQKINQLKKIHMKSQNYSIGHVTNGVNNSTVYQDSYSPVIYEPDFSNSSLSSLNTIVEDCSEFSREELEASYRSLLKKVNHLQQESAASKLNGIHHFAVPALPANPQLNHLHDNACCNLGAKLLEANLKVVQLEKALEAKRCASSSRDSSFDQSRDSPRDFSSCNSDSDWPSEKFKLTSVIKILEEKIDYLNTNREKLESELQEMKEKNELLEFRLLEIENNSRDVRKHLGDSNLIKIEDSYSDSSFSKSVCDRSVSTNDDEGFCSADCSSDELSETNEPHIFNSDDLRIRFTLLKHRKDLKEADRLVISQVKDEWERLQNHHVTCKSNQMEMEMKSREIESMWQLKVDTLQSEMTKLEEKLANTHRKLVRLKETKNEYEHLLNRYYKLQKIQTETSDSIVKYKAELEKLQYILKRNRYYQPQSLLGSHLAMCQNGSVLSEKDLLTKFTIEKAHLQKQLCQQRNYCRQLEKQFEIQLATVKLLKNELLTMKRDSACGNVDLAHKEVQVDSSRDDSERLIKQLLLMNHHRNFKIHSRSSACRNSQTPSQVWTWMEEESEKVYQSKVDHFKKDHNHINFKRSLSENNISLVEI